MKRHALTIMQSIAPIFLSFLLFVDEQRTNTRSCVRFILIELKDPAEVQLQRPAPPSLQ